MCATFTKMKWRNFLSCFGTIHSENLKLNAKNQLSDQNEKWNYSGVCAQQLQAVVKGRSVLETFIYVFVLVVINFVYLLPSTLETEEYISFVWGPRKLSFFSVLPVHCRANVLVDLILYERNFVYSVFLELLCLFSSLNKCCVIES